MLQQLTILAPGLLGSSVARAANALGVARRIVVWARRKETQLELRKEAWCHDVAETAEEAVRGAALVVLAPPVDCIVPLIRQIAPHIEPGAVVTDVGSVKGELCRQARTALGKNAVFVGSHPMAGSEKTGWQAGSQELFSRRTCFVTPASDTPHTAADIVIRFWHDLGMEVVTVTPDAHDEIVAHISHLPQILASSLCAFLAGKNESWRNYAGGGLRDTTRIAGSDPAMWRPILKANRDEILRALRAYQDELHAFTAALANGDDLEVAARLERGKAYRDKFRPPPSS